MTQERTAPRRGADQEADPFDQLLAAEHLPRTRDPRRRRRGPIVALALLLVVLLGAGGYSAATLLAPLPLSQAQLRSVAPERPAAAELAWPGYGASAIGAPEFGGVLASSGAATPVPMASITKLITAEVVLQAKPLSVGQDGPSITFTAADAEISRRYVQQDGRVSPVVVGSRLSQLQVMQLALVHSANNYAESLAVWAYGSVSAYLDAARTWLQAKGLGGIQIVDPAGISPDNRGTASDLVKLGELVLDDPLLAQLVDTESITVPGVGTYANSNALLGVDGIDGIKTGTLDDFGANLLFSTQQQIGDTRVRVVGVILGGVDHPSLDVDVRRLLASVQRSFHEVDLADEGEVVATYATPWGAKADAVAAESRRVTVWSDAPVAGSATVRQVQHATAGARVGTLAVSAAGQSFEVPVRLRQAIADPGPEWRLTHPLELLAAG